MGNIEKAVQFMENVAKDNTHGYDQTHRNGPNYDCSSLLGTALHEAGFDVSPSSWTGNIRKQLLANGFEEIDVKAERKRGDIFLTESKHTIMCIDSNNIVHASINEKGTTTGGVSGDQTGTEICTRSFYTPSYGWQYHFRIKGVEEPKTESANIVAGKVVTLKDTNCYTSQTGKEPYGTKTGTFYLWDASVKNNRIRITNKAERVGVKGQVTCWVNIDDINLTETKTENTPNKETVSTPIKEIRCTKTANSYDKVISNTYEVTASWLNVRNGAGTTHSVLTSIPKGTKVHCYGYYTLVGSTKWLYVQFTYKDVKYTGFTSMTYLKA